MKKTIESLIVTMKLSDVTKLRKIKVATDAIVANQSDNSGDEVYDIEGNKCRIVSTKTKGVGKNRNIALLYSEADICLLCDDDVTYKENYKRIIENAFDKLPDADAIIFNIETTGKKMRRRKNTRVKKVNFFNFRNYGAVRVAFKRESIMYNNIWFSSMFGGGTNYSSGEDTVFIRDVLKAGLKIYTYPEVICEVNQTESTWFEGYNKKFFFDKGALLYFIHPLFHYIYSYVFYVIRFRKVTELSIFQIRRALVDGKRAFKQHKDYCQFYSNNEE